MLKRHQVLLDDWATKHLRNIAEEMDISFSEAIRLAICLYAGELARALHPEYKFPFQASAIAKILTDAKSGKVNESQVHKLISEIYFESRKAMEYIEQKKKKTA